MDMVIAAFGFLAEVSYQLNKSIFLYQYHLR